MLHRLSGIARKGALALATQTAKRRLAERSAAWRSARAARVSIIFPIRHLVIWFTWAFLIAYRTYARSQKDWIIHNVRRS
ncbi:hypothetical protein DP117_02595 [Brasilonema sp. UFV-L1]|nr:hypothetical protein [Brasilonema sp. UFV-L1]